MGCQHAAQKGGHILYEASTAFHQRYSALYDRPVRVTLKDGTQIVGLFNDEFYECGAILVGCQTLFIADIVRMEPTEPSEKEETP